MPTQPATIFAAPSRAASQDPRAACPAPVAPRAQPVAAGYVPPEDRLPTFAEVDGFDANRAWDRLSPLEQRRLGIMAVRLSAVGNRLCFDHSDWSEAEVDLIQVREQDLLQEFFEVVEPLWQVLFGWVTGAAASDITRDVSSDLTMDFHSEIGSAQRVAA